MQSTAIDGNRPQPSLLCTALLAAGVLFLSGCGGGDAKGIREYVGRDLPAILALEREANERLAAINTLEADRFRAIRPVLADEVLPRLDEAVERCGRLRVRSEGLDRLHQEYRRLLSEQRDRMTRLLDAARNRDQRRVDAINRELTDYQRARRQWLDRLKALAAEHGLRFARAGKPFDVAQDRPPVARGGWHDSPFAYSNRPPAPLPRLGSAYRPRLVATWKKPTPRWGRHAAPWGSTKPFIGTSSVWAGPRV